MHPRVLQFPGVLLASYVLSACPPPADNSRSRTYMANNRGSSGSSRATSPTTSPTTGPTTSPATGPTTSPTTGPTASPATGPTASPTTTPTRAGAFSGTVEAPQGVTPVTTACNASTPETCNGLDDNCDGVIDNNCGYAGGGIQITANWRGAADVDLRVTDPASEEVYFGHRTSASGAQMDIEANGDCTATRPPTAENVRWSTPTPPAGRYEIKLVAMDLCGAQDAAVTFSVSVGGRIVGAWTVPFTYPRQEYVFPLTVR